MNWRDDKTVIVLCFFTIFFAVVTIGIVCFRPQDGEIRAVFTGLLGSFAGALIMYLKVDKSIPPGSTVISKVEQTTKTPEVPIA